MPRLSLAILLVGLALAVPAASAAIPEGVVKQAISVAQDIGQDPGAAVSDPAGTLDPLLQPDQQADDGSAAPPEGVDPGFAQRLRAEFRDQLMFAGIAGVTAVALSVAGFALVTRYITPKEALKNPQRAMLYGFVKGNPGVHLKKLSEEFSMKTSSILWHIRKLESAQLVRSERANGFRVFYPTEGGVAVKQVGRATAALQNGNARVLFEVLDRHPGQTAQELAAKSQIHAGTVRWHLKKLKEFGLVEEMERVGNPLYFATPLGSKALAGLARLPDSAGTGSAVAQPAA